MKTGLHKDDGHLITGLEYLRQRLGDAINTPLGSLVGRRAYGSNFYKLLDRNVDGDFYMNAFVSLAETVNNPANGLEDFKLQQMSLNKEAANHYSITITGQYLEDAALVTISGIDVYGRV